MVEKVSALCANLGCSSVDKPGEVLRAARVEQCIGAAAAQVRPEL